MKIGISWGGFGGLTPEQEIEHLKKNGFEATFVGNEYENFDRDVTALQSAGISIETIHAPFDRINDIWLPGEAGDEMLARLIHCGEDAKAHGIPTIVIHMSSGITPPIISDIGNSRFAKLMDRLGALGITAAFENQRKLANLALMLEYYEEARFCWDTGHEACFTPGREYMPLFGGKLAALHVHDNTCEFNKDYHLLPYDGSIDFDRVAKQIAQSGFNGTVMLEVGRWANDRYKETAPEEYFARAAQAARRLRDKILDFRKN